MFPHHENERAECLGCGRPFARTWVHNGMVQVGSEKMSKSLGNFQTLADLLDNWDPRALRLLVLQTHYRKTMEITETTLTTAAAALDRLDTFTRRMEAADLPDLPSDPTTVERFRTAMDDDLGTAGALAAIFDAVRDANRALDAEDHDSAAALTAAALELTTALGLELGDQARPNQGDRADIDALVAARSAAKETKDYDLADQIRKELTGLGIVLEDSTTGTTWHRS
jgi:cysteinyl-tRNA synthetase